jgi:hypothetical protein
MDVTGLTAISDAKMTRSPAQRAKDPEGESGSALSIGNDRALRANSAKLRTLPV